MQYLCMLMCIITKTHPFTFLNILMFLNDFIEINISFVVIK